MKNRLAVATALVLLAAPAFGQSAQDPQQHHPGGVASGSPGQSAPAQSATPPSTSSAQPQPQAPMGGMMQGMHGMMSGQGQGGSGTMMGRQSGMMMSCPMMEGIRGMGAQGMAAAGGMMPMLASGGHMMKVMFAVADANGDGALSFEQITAIHKRIFDRVDTSNDGKVTVEELQSFMRE